MDSMIYQSHPVTRSKRDIRLLTIPDPDGTAPNNLKASVQRMATVADDAEATVSIQEFLDAIFKYRHLTMSVVSLNDNPQYFALSYVWGDQTDRVSITVDGHKCMIGQNLMHAFIALYCQQVPLPVWIDAICLDQQNAAEKNWQVPLMGDIYQQAQIVVISLGAPIDFPGYETHEVFKLLEGLSQAWMSAENYMNEEHNVNCETCSTLPDSERSTHLVETRLRQLEYAVERIDPEEKGRTAMSLFFFSHEWFQRVWIMQEIALARRALFVSYEHVLLWDDFWNGCQAYNMLEKRGEGYVPFDEGSYNLSPYSDEPKAWVIEAFVIAYLRREFNKNNLLSLKDMMMLFYTSNRSCTDERDKVYACLKLLKDEDRKQIHVDYDPLNPSFQVFAEAMEIMLRSDTRNVNLLAYCRFNKSSLRETCPTWVPRWDWIVQKWGSFFFVNPDLFNASGSRCMDPTNFKGCAKTGILDIEATGIGYVKKIMPQIKDERLQQSFDRGGPRPASAAAHVQRWLSEMERLLRETENPYEEEELEDVLWRTIISDSWRWPKRRRACPTDKYGFDVLQGKIKPPTDASDDEWLVRESLLYVQNCYWQGTTFLTDNGYTGLVHDENVQIEVGDIACIVLGATMPFIFRPVDAKEELELIGPVYIHGLMDGDLLLGEDENLPVEKIKLC